MNFNKSGNPSKDLEFIRNISKKINRKLSQSPKPVDSTIDKLTLEELQDLSKITGLADFMLTKYEDKKETKSILEYFVSIIRETAESIDQVDDEVAELIITSEDSINKIKQMHSNISDKYDFEKQDVLTHEDEDENSSNNLTKVPIEINSNEYLENSPEKGAQVI